MSQAFQWWANLNDNGRYEPYNNLGIVLAQMGDLDGAKIQFNKAVLADPSNTAAQNNLRRATSPDAK